MFHLFLKANIPKINLGTTPKGTEIIKEGIQQTTLNVFKANDQNKFIIGKDFNQITFYISYAVANVSLSILKNKGRKANERTNAYL